MEAIIHFFLASMECFIKRRETNDSKNGKNGRAQPLEQVEDDEKRKTAGKIYSLVERKKWI